MNLLRRINSFFKKLFKFLILSVVFSIFFILVILGASWFQYKSWFKDNSDELELSFVRPEDPVFRDLDSKLSEFENSLIQKETLTLSCNHVNALLYKVAEDNWQNSNIEKIGAVCKDRSITVYLKRGDNLWIIVDVWQKEEGMLQFAVFDVRIGSISLGTLTSGFFTGVITEGIEEALKLVSSDSYSGRKISEIYLEEDGIRIVGNL